MSKPIRPAIQILFNSAKVSQLLSEYDYMVMQSKSPNVLVANYSWLKLNGLFTVLLAAGIQFNELDQRRRDIIKKAIVYETIGDLNVNRRTIERTYTPKAVTDLDGDGDIDAQDDAILTADDDFGFNEGIKYL